VSTVSWATPLYEFLRQCNEADLERNVLDCGAGGSDRPATIAEVWHVFWSIQMAICLHLGVRKP
jgi:hypothetical protein